MGSRNENTGNAVSKAFEEFAHVFQVSRAQGREAREGRSPMAVKGRGNPPNPAFALPKFALLGFRVFDQAIGGSVTTA